MASKEADQYRFSGYRMPMIQMDSTGAGYILLRVSMIHPENRSQPPYFAKPSYREDSAMSSSQRRAAVFGRLYKPLS